MITILKKVDDRSWVLKIFLAGLILFNFNQANSQYDFTTLDKTLASQRRTLGGNACVLVYKDNQVVFSRNIGQYNSDTREPIASCSKWLTAALVMTFVDEGKLSVDDYIAKYLPQFSEDGKALIKIRYCLSHTSGIESKPITLGSLVERKKFSTLAEEVNTFAVTPMAGEPGKVFAYSNIGLNIVGRILEVISGKDFESLFQERIARPLGMNNTTFAGKYAINPSGGAISTASDYLKFLSMILGNGIYQGKRILSENSIRLMQQSETTNARILYVPGGAEEFEYGFGEWIQGKDADGNSTIISSPGLFGTYPVIDKIRNYAAIIFVKNLQVRNRKETDSAIKEAIDLSFTKQ